MGNSLINVSLHIIFHVKSTGCTMQAEHLPRILRYIGGTIRAMGGRAYTIGGMQDHVHILTSLPVTMSLADFVRNIKSNSSRWIKGLDMCYNRFSWQEGYGAFSVSESMKEAVIAYIDNQARHHQRHTAHEEFALFMKKYGVHDDSAAMD